MSTDLLQKLEVLDRLYRHLDDLAEEIVSYRAILGRDITTELLASAFVVAALIADQYNDDARKGSRRKDQLL